MDFMAPPAAQYDPLGKNVGCSKKDFFAYIIIVMSTIFTCAKAVVGNLYAKAKVDIYSSFMGLQYFLYSLSCLLSYFHPL